MTKSKMKKFRILLLLCVIFSFFTFDATSVYADATSEIVMDVNSGRILFNANENERKHVASTTKILTCITAIENGDLNKKITIKQKWCGIEGSSIYLQPNEKYTLEQLLYGMMLRSGNDAATAISESVCDSEQEFVKLMNQTAKRVGATTSNFENPHGLDSLKHYSTARDLALITSYALRNPTFKQIVSTKKYSFKRDEQTVVWHNKNKLLSSYKYAIGVKTGYTKKSGRCLVSAAEKDGQVLVCVVLNVVPTYERSQELFESTYEKYENVKLLSKDESVCSMSLSNGTQIPVYVENDEFYPLTKQEKEHVKSVVIFDDEVSFPLKFHQKVGLIRFYLEKQLLFERKLYTII